MSKITQAEEREQTWRRDRLADALRTFFQDNKAALGRALGYDSGAFIHQLVTGKRPIREKVVKQIEALPGLAGWFTPKGLLIEDQAEIAMILNYRRWIEEQRRQSAADAPDDGTPPREAGDVGEAPAQPPQRAALRQTPAVRPARPVPPPLPNRRPRGRASSSSTRRGM